MSTWSGGINSYTGGPYDENGLVEDGGLYTPVPVDSVTAQWNSDGTYVTVSLSWPSSSSGGNGLEYIITNDDGEHGVYLTSGTTHTFAYTNEFADGKTFTYGVSTRVISSGNTSTETLSNAVTISIYVDNTTYPDPPTDVFATSINNGNDIQITWTPPEFNGNSEITGYRVYDSELKGDILVQSTGVSTILANTNPRRSAFTAFITAVNSFGESIAGVSNALVIPPLGGPLPASPKILAPVLGDLRITLNWTGVSPTAVPVTSYKLTRSDDVDFLFETSVGGTSGTYDITDGLVVGTPVTFTVTSVNANGECLVPASITVNPASKPSPPPHFAAYVGSIRGTALLYWPPNDPANAGTPVTGYVLTYNEIVINLGASALSFMVYIKDGQPVTFSLVAKNKVGVSDPIEATINGIYVDPTSITTLTIPDPPPYFVAYVGKTPGTVVLYWLPQSPINGGTPLTGYILTYNGITTNLGSGSLTFSDNVVPEQPITFRLVAKNKIGLSTALFFDLLGGGDVTDAIFPRNLPTTGP